MRVIRLSGPPTPDPVVGLPDGPNDKPIDDLSHVTFCARCSCSMW